MSHCERTQATGRATTLLRLGDQEREITSVIHYSCRRRSVTAFSPLSGMYSKHCVGDSHECVVGCPRLHFSQLPSGRSFSMFQWLLSCRKRERLRTCEFTWKENPACSSFPAELLYQGIYAMLICVRCHYACACCHSSRVRRCIVYLRILCAQGAVCVWRTKQHEIWHCLAW